MTRHIFSVTPIHVDADELARRRRRYAELSPDGVRVHLVDVGPHAPRQLADETDLHASERAVRAVLAEQYGQGYDYLMPDCVLDPAVPGARPQVRGMLRLVLSHLVSTGHQVAAVTRNQAIGDELRRRARVYGFDESLLAVAVLRLGPDSVADAQKWNAAMRTALEDLAGQGATAVLNGCSAVDVTDRPETGPLVVDPAATALALFAGEGPR